MVPPIGYAIREQIRPLFSDPAIDAAEITLERASDPLPCGGFLQDADFDYVCVHAPQLTFAGRETPGRDYLDAVKSTAAETGAGSVSARLNVPGGPKRAQFVTPAYTPKALQATCRNVDIVQTFFGETRLYVENIDCRYRFAGTMTEAEFLASVLRKTGCGWLLDVTNVYANALNFGYDAYEFVEEVMPAAAHLQLHLTGTFFDRDEERFLDSGSHRIPQGVLDLYEFALEEASEKVAAVFIERDQNVPDQASWREDVRLVREIAESTCALACADS